MSRNAKSSGYWAPSPSSATAVPSPAATGKAIWHTEVEYIGDWRAPPPWPKHLASLVVPRGQEFYAHVEDPADWHRTGLFKYVVVGWDSTAGLYEAWEASGLHTRGFSETAVIAGAAPPATAASTVASWERGEVTVVPKLDSSGWPRRWCRDQVFAPHLSGWKPYGTLEMAGPALFHLAARRQRDPDTCRIVCDIGAGTGRLAFWLNQAWGFEVTALDIELPKYPEYGVDLFDGRNLPLLDKSVDCVMFSFVLHHCRHFELQRALLNEAARVSRGWIIILEDTPASERDRKATRGHDHLGTFHDTASWRATFGRLKLELLHEGPLWEGPKRKPSPYPCARSFYIIEVPSWLRPQPLPSSRRLPGLAGCCSAACGFMAFSPGGGIQGKDEAKDASEVLETKATTDLRAEWFIISDPTDASKILGPTRESTSQGPSALPDVEVIGAPHCAPLESFEHLRLPASLVGALRSQGFVAPTPIQRAVVPIALTGIDLVGVAQTGSGKTLAYLLPSVLRLMSRGVFSQIGVLVLAPTRELVLQIASCAEVLLWPASSALVDDAACAGVALGLGAKKVEEHIAVAAIWGGAPRWEQQRRLRDGVALVVATPGRLLDLACSEEEEGRELLSAVEVLVLDEGDRMLEEGMGDQLDALAQRTPLSRQTLFFSATWPEAAGAVARRFCRGAREPAVVRVGAVTASGASCTNSNITQRVEVFDMEGEEEEQREARKFARLLEMLSVALNGDCGGDSGPALGGKAMVFCMTKKFADSLVVKLADSGLVAVAVHGNKSQDDRIWYLGEFAEGRARVLVTTDVLGRGLDIPEVSHVFVYDIPGSMEEYMHRIGRTARGIAKRGEAVAFFEFVPSVPGLAGELVAHLESIGQDVPSQLRTIAASVSSGERGSKAEDTWRRHRDPPPVTLGNVGAVGEGAIASSPVDGGGSKVEEVPLARTEELGAWHSRGQRCWNYCEGEEACRRQVITGWFVLRSGGHLQTDAGSGTWRLLEGNGHLVVDLASGVQGVCSESDGSGKASRQYELELQHWWQGQKRDHFAVVAAATSFVGWVASSKSKTHKYEDVDS